MKLKQVLDHLTNNELAQHRIGGYADGHVMDVDIPKILSTINQGIVVINQRVNLLTKVSPVILSVSQTTYVMDKASTYIDDPTFPTNFKKFIQITDGNGKEYLLNVRDVPESLAIPAYNVFQHPSPIEGDIAIVEYEYDPEELVASTYAEACLLEYPLPYFTVAALYAYVSMKMEEGMTIQEVLAKNTTGFSKFDFEIEQLKSYVTTLGDTYYGSKFHNNGWR